VRLLEVDSSDEETLSEEADVGLEGDDLAVSPTRDTGPCKDGGAPKVEPLRGFRA
jgi:hypothetical protein